jgi:hypothetical protein
MKRKRSYCILNLLAVACLILLFTSGCAREEKYIGSYEATEKSPPEVKGMWVELKEDGKGIRRIHGEEVSFEWRVKGSELRIHTPAGGILVAKMSNGILEVSLPGSKVLYLKKVK